MYMDHVVVYYCGTAQETRYCPIDKATVTEEYTQFHMIYIPIHLEHVVPKLKE